MRTNKIVVWNDKVARNLPLFAIDKNKVHRRAKPAILTDVVSALVSLKRG